MVCHSISTRFDAAAYQSACGEVCAILSLRPMMGSQVVLTFSAIFGLSHDGCFTFHVGEGTSVAQTADVCQ